jgi:hypothetical protein
MFLKIKIPGGAMVEIPEKSVPITLIFAEVLPDILYKMGPIIIQQGHHGRPLLFRRFRIFKNRNSGQNGHME